MKKLLVLIIINALPFLFFSCGAPNHLYSIGTTEAEFVKSCYGCKVVELSKEGSVYKGKWAKFGEAGGYEYRFFYFEKGILVKMDEGERVFRPDIIIQNQH